MKFLFLNELYLLNKSSFFEEAQLDWEKDKKTLATFIYVPMCMHVWRVKFCANRSPFQVFSEKNISTIHKFAPDILHYTFICLQIIVSFLSE